MKMFYLACTGIAVILISYFFRRLVQKIYVINVYLSSIILYSMIILFTITIMVNPKQSINAALKGLNLWTNAVFPSLFPFFVSTELLINLGFVHIMGAILEPIMRPIFNVPGSGSFAFSLGIISGYPVGAKTTVNLRQNGLCSKIEGERLLTFCNNAGPLFILGSVAAAMFNEPSVGVILFVSHLLASLTVGFIFRFYKAGDKKENIHQRKENTGNIMKEIIKQIKEARKKDGRNVGEMFGDAIKNAIQLLIAIAGFIVFFSVLINLLNHLYVISFLSKLLSVILIPLGIANELLPSIVSGFFEITTGIKIASACSTVPLDQRLIAASLILGWAGLSVHCQVISIVSKSDISTAPYLIGKSIQGILSAIYTFILLQLIPLSLPASSVLNAAAEELSNRNILNSFFYSLIYLGNVLFYITILCILVAIVTTASNTKSKK